MKKIIRGLLAGVFAFSVGSAQAALIDRSGGMLYDDVLNITWLQDANYAKTSGYDADGKMTWSEANIWAANLSFGGYDDWRLASPETGFTGCTWSYGGTNCGYNSTSGEMTHMYYNNLGFQAPFTTSGVYQPTIYAEFGNGSYGDQHDVGLVRNLQSSHYWSNSMVQSGVFTWHFDFSVGQKNWNIAPSNLFYAWAVRDGDVAVPEPTSLMLLGIALAGLGAARRRKSV